MAPGISLCMLASGPPARVRAVLEQWAPHVDEVVVAVDARHHPDLTASIADLVDRLYVVPAPARDIVEDVLLWLHRQCTRAWIVRADDDEVPMPGFFDELGEVIRRGEVTHAYFPSRWVFPDAEHVLASDPWREIQVPRVLRNEPGLWRSPEMVHTTIGALGAYTLMERGILHLVLMLSPLAERREKVRRYERAGAGPAHDSGLSVNAVYVPEDRADVMLERLPDDQAQLARDVLRSCAQAAPSTGAPAGAAAARSVTVAEVDRYTLADELGDGAYRARLELLRPPASIPADGTRHVVVAVTNLGDVLWPWEADPARQMLRLGQRWYRADGSEIDWDGPRAFLTEPVEPGRTSRSLIALHAPPEPGAHTVAVDLVHELVRWFGVSQRLTVTVTED